jgi:hypothetical protein
LLKSEINNQAEFIKDQFGVITAKPRSPDIVSEDDDAPEPPQDIHSSQFDFFFSNFIYSVEQGILVTDNRWFVEATLPGPGITREKHTAHIPQVKPLI